MAQTNRLACAAKATRHADGPSSSWAQNPVLSTRAYRCQQIACHFRESFRSGGKTRLGRGAVAYEIVVEIGAGGAGVGRGVTVAHRPELGVFEEGVPGGQAADDDAGATVEPAAAEHEELQKPQRGVREQLQP